MTVVASTAVSSIALTANEVKVQGQLSARRHDSIRPEAQPLDATSTQPLPSTSLSSSCLSALPSWSRCRCHRHITIIHLCAHMRKTTWAQNGTTRKRFTTCCALRAPCVFVCVHSRMSGKRFAKRRARKCEHERILLYKYATLFPNYFSRNAETNTRTN